VKPTHQPLDTSEPEPYFKSEAEAIAWEKAYTELVATWIKCRTNTFHEADQQENSRINDEPGRVLHLENCTHSIHLHTLQLQPFEVWDRRKHPNQDRIKHTSDHLDTRRQYSNLNAPKRLKTARGPVTMGKSKSKAKRA
jgi:hypothetical protein